MKSNQKPRDSIKFTKGKTSVKLEYSSQPVINLIRGSLLDFEKNWVTRFTSAFMQVNISTDGGKTSSQEPVSLGALIGPYHSAPIVELNQTVKYLNTFTGRKVNKQTKWIIEISLLNFQFFGKESIVIEYMDTNYINRRLDDWEQRVADFYTSVGEWISELDGYSIRQSNLLEMNEEMMQTFGADARQVPSMDVLHQKKLKMLIKPVALWIMGGNGRIDLMMQNKNFITVDSAERFEPPKWKVFLKDSRTDGTELNKKVFKSILEL